MLLRTCGFDSCLAMRTATEAAVIGITAYICARDHGDYALHLCGKQLSLHICCLCPFCMLLIRSRIKSDTSCILRMQAIAAAADAGGSGVAKEHDLSSAGSSALVVPASPLLVQTCSSHR